MLPSSINREWRVKEIAFATLKYRRPRSAGCNARLGVHGIEGETPIARVRIGDTYGFGWSRISQKDAAELVGKPFGELFSRGMDLRNEYAELEFPILDWLGQAEGKPVYELAMDGVFADDSIVKTDKHTGGAYAEDGIAENDKHTGGAVESGKYCGGADSGAVGSGQRVNCAADSKAGYKVPVYDTSIYFDELHIKDDAEAVDLLCGEVEYGRAHGHCNFKVKVGRCGLWMETEAGMKRDVSAILAIRRLIGKEGRLMADANNGYNYNLARRFLDETRAAEVYWLEEAFHEDGELYMRLKEWMSAEGIGVLIADGEGYASPDIIDLARRGLVNALQFDLRGYGFLNWLRLANKLDGYGVYSAPHNYGGYYGNYAQAHIAGAIKKFAFAEWDQASVPEIDDGAYSIKNGFINVPGAPGFGLNLDEKAFDKAVKLNGWRVQ